MNFHEKVKTLQNYFTAGKFKRVVEGCDALNKKFPNNSFILNLSGMAYQRLDKDDLSKMNVLRRIISPMGTMDAIEFINSKLKETKSNADFFSSMNKPA